MPRLTHPSVGTVVTCEGDLAESYRSAGWSEEGQQVEATTDKPKPTTRRTRKTRTE